MEKVEIYTPERHFEFTDLGQITSMLSTVHNELFGVRLIMFVNANEKFRRIRTTFWKKFINEQFLEHKIVQVVSDQDDELGIVMDPKENSDILMEKIR